MPLEVFCDCLLCDIEARLTSELCFAEKDVLTEILYTSNGLRQFSSVSSLLSHIRGSSADARSDELLRALFAARKANAAWVDSLLVLTFLPMLHHTIRRVARQQSSLSQDDITQQALSFLLQFLRSDELNARQSHFAFAISRAMKRQIFEWGNREGGRNSVTHDVYDQAVSARLVDEPFERYTFLRHFLYRCVTRELLSPMELDLLIQFKLEGGNADENVGSTTMATNAVRQKLKRLLAKLRRLARD